LKLQYEQTLSNSAITFNLRRYILGQYYLVFVVGKEDLLARRFDKVTAHVQFRIQ